MSESPISPVLLELMERAINQYLALSSDYQNIFEPLQGNVIALDFTGVGQKIYIIPGLRGLQLSDTCLDEPVTTISGSPLAFLGLVLKSDSPMSLLFSGRLQLSGDVSVGKLFQQAISRLTIPWEQHLGRYIGLENSHRLLELLRSGREWQRYAGQQLELDLAEYLQEEVQLAVAPNLAEGFFNDIDALRNSADRLEIRIRQLEKQLNPDYS